MDPTNGSDHEGDEKPRRGRSASVGEAGEVSRENSSSSEAQAEGGTSEGGSSNFEASLLLGISGSLPEKERREPADPATLPNSMTSFLDILTEEQRRVRHRHIPGVDGFRKLYRSEVKADMSEARKMKRTKTVKESDSMEVEGEGEENENASAASDGKDGGEKEEKLQYRNAFLAPGKEVRLSALGGQLAGMLASDDFEAAAAANSAPADRPSPQRSPRLVDSLASFDPPRPQESTAAKTRHRLRRWEAHPAEVEVDLANYRKTVARTREELRGATEERELVESCAGLVRGHFAEHLKAYRKEMLVANEKMQEVQASCIKLEKEHGGRSTGTRGSAARGMDDAVTTLKAMGEEAARAGGPVGQFGGPADWRAEGVGGVAVARGQGWSAGWIIPGDVVIVRSSGEQGTVVHVRGPEEAASRMADAEKRAKDAAARRKAGKGGDAMDVDSPGNERQAVSAGLAASIGVKISGSSQVRDYHVSEITFHPRKPRTLPHNDSDLVKRWELMAQTALANAADHDALVMEEYINASLTSEKKAEEDAAAAEAAAANKTADGRVSPKSVVRHGDVRALLPFGAGQIAAPADVKCFPSLIPLDTLEERVRKVAYKTGKPRVSL